MTQEKKVQAAVVMNVSSVETSAQDAVRFVKTMADAITREGEKAGKGLEGMGDGAKRAERSVDVATKSLVDKLRRAVREQQGALAGLAATSSGGRGSASALEYEAILRGADAAKLQPKIAELRLLQAHVASLNASMQQALQGEAFVNSINQRVEALQRQALGLKATEAEMLSLRAAELGLTQQADPLIAKLRETATAVKTLEDANRNAAAGKNFLTGLTDQANAIGKTRADLLQLKATQLGVADQAAPMIAAIRAADGELQGMGKNAKLTAAALRTVPAQFTDIVVSLQAGQNPLQVLLQQGGQLKDSFGGAGIAARALGSYIVGLIGPFSLAAGAAAALAFAYKLGSDEASAYSRAIILSGQAAGVTAGQLQAMASGVAALGAGTQGRAAEILAQLATSADVGAGNMQRFTAAALAFEKVGGGAAEETAKAFQSLADKPLQAALKLNETTNFLTQRTYEQIKALTEQGRTTDAARVAQEAYSTAIESRTPQLAGALGYVERAWLSIKNATKGAFDAALNIGRGNTLDGQIEALRQRIESAQTGIYSRDKVPELRQELALLQEQQRMLQRGAEAAAAQAAALRAAADFDKQALDYRKDGKRLADEILQIRQRGLTAGKSEAEVVALIAAVVERTAKTSTAPASKRDVFKAEEAAARSYMQALEALATIQQQAGASSEGLTKTQAKLRDVQADPAWQTYSRQQQEQIITQAAAAQSAEDQAAAIKAGAKVAAEAARDYAQWVQELGRSGSAVAAQVQALEDEARAVQIAASGHVTLKQAIEDVALARLREQQAAALGNPDAVLAIQREIDAREKLRGLIGEKEQREAAAGAAKEWARSAEKIGDSITDALMRGFESGKGFAESLRDTVVNMFKSMVLKPVISAIVSPISGAISGAVGGALGLGAASAAAGGLSAGAGAGIAGAGLLGGAFGAFGSGVASGLTAWGAGGSVTGLLGTGSALFSGGIASGVGTLVGALGPIALGAAAIYALAKSLDNGGTPHVGSIYGIGTDGRNGATLTRQTAGGYQLGTTFSAAGNSSPEIRSTVAQFTTSLAATFGAAMQTFGLRQGDVRAGFAADNDDPSAGRITIRGADGRVLADSFARYAASASKGFEEFAADAGRVLRDALVAADLPGWADGLLVDLGSRPTIEAVQQMVQSIAQLRSVFDAFGGTLGLTQTEVVGLAKAFGGVGELASGLSGYLASVYTDSERLDLAQRSLSSAFAQMGQSVPANAAAYRSLVDAQDLSTDAGRATYAAMVKLAPAFAEVTAAANEAAAEQARLAEQVATQRNGLETQLLRLYGDTNELRRRELAALDPANRALQARIYALEDAKSAADAATDLGDAWRGVAETIEEEIERITGLNRTQTASLSQIQAEFVTATAQARAGDKAAAERLPELSATLLDLAQKSATSAAEVTAVRASVLDSLAQTAQIVRTAGTAAEQAANARLGSLLAAGGVGGADASAEATLAKALGDVLALLKPDQATPSKPPAWASFAGGGMHAGGLRLVGENGPELEVTGPARIWSADQTARMLGGFDQAALLAELRALRAEVVDLRAEARATAGHTGAMSRLHKRWDDTGLLVRTDEDTPLTTTVI